ncbi:hypothetical protein BH10PLA1_BH10PLA1_05200 [soil metagenome]
MVQYVLLTASPAGGGYINPFKLIVMLVIVGVWMRLLTWVDKDTEAATLPREPINAGLLIGMIGGLWLFFFLPGFAIGLLALIFVMLLEAGIYLGWRFQKVGLADLKGEISGMSQGLKPADRPVEARADQIQFIDKSERLRKPPVDEGELVVYQALQGLLDEPFRKNAEQVDILPSDAVMAVLYAVDGVAYRGQTVDHELGSEIITYLKQMAGLDVAERRRPQSGEMKISYNGARRELQINTRGSNAGEQISMIADSKKRHDRKLDELGLGEDQLEILKDTIAANAGIVLVTAPTGNGLTSLLYAIIRSHDAFLTQIQTVERNATADLEGVTQNKLPIAASGSDEAKMVSWVCDQEPDTVAVSSLQDTRSAQLLAKFAKKGKRVYIGMKASSTLEALALWRKLVGDDPLALNQLTLIVSERLVRLLCNACKVGYSPDPTMLRKLNMDPDRVSKLYQARTTAFKNDKGVTIECEFCHELHFKGRTGVFELFVIDDDAKNAVLSGASGTQLKMVFRKQRGRYLQEQALLLVEKGDTSVQEVLRVLKADNESAAKPPATGAAPAH